VADALQNDRWIVDITGSLSITALVHYVSVWTSMQEIQLDQGREDRFIWKWSSNQQYSASSAYRAFFHGQSSIPGAKELSASALQAFHLARPIGSVPDFSSVAATPSSKRWPLRPLLF
jgi:hypothetical protein